MKISKLPVIKNTHMGDISDFMPFNDLFSSLVQNYINAHPTFSYTQNTNHNHQVKITL